MPDARPSFRELALSLASQQNRTTILPVIEKELLHYEILDTMDEAGYLERLAFQGGTCLRLAYGSERYSEDLDFCAGPTFASTDFEALAGLLTAALTRRYDLEVEVDSPASPEPAGVGVAVTTWRIRVVTAPRRRDLPKQRISIQVANAPAHSRVVNALRTRHPGLPSSYADVLLICESLEEICADKLKAFVTSRFIRYRDLWDLRWISTRPGFDAGQLPMLLHHKILDYDAARLFEDNQGRLQRLAEIVEEPAFVDQLTRFLPAQTVTQTIGRPVFRAHIAERVRALYDQAGVRSNGGLPGPGAEPPG
ncbi:MAG: nucleotidyl transferase AbiEii/AbiGii toxin family protein [Bifidobacteriaceae bacterium]|nr:nucleotidyl transferase AbiEii/AbiGii toxin family protein [Bifidobacteriaceae bacterium]